MKHPYKYFAILFHNGATLFEKVANTEKAEVDAREFAQKRSPQSEIHSSYEITEKEYVEDFADTQKPSAEAINQYLKSLKFEYECTEFIAAYMEDICKDCGAIIYNTKCYCTAEE